MDAKAKAPRRNKDWRPTEINKLIEAFPLDRAMGPTLDDPLIKKLARELERTPMGVQGKWYDLTYERRHRDKRNKERTQARIDEHTRGRVKAALGAVLSDEQPPKAQVIEISAVSSGLVGDLQKLVDNVEAYEAGIKHYRQKFLIE